MRVAIFAHLLLLLLSPFCLSMEAPSLEDLESGIKKHIRSYDGLEFSLTASLHQEDNGGKQIVFSLPDLRETIRLHFPEKGPTWKYWAQEIQDKYDGKWIVNSFKVTNVAKTHNFTYFPEPAGQWSRGSITPWHEWNEEQGRHFFTFLGLDTVGLSLLRFDVSNKIWDESVKKLGLQFVKEERFGEQKVWVFHGRINWGPEKNDYAVIKLHILHPQNMVIHWEISVGKDRMYYIVDDVGIFEGTYYPLKGKFHQGTLATDEKDRKITYEFEVTNVLRYSAKLLNNWFPEWPSGTNVRNIGTDKVTHIPPTERQLEKIVKIRASQSHRLVRHSSMVVCVVMMTSGLVMILYALYRMRRNRQQ